ncbi:MAG: 1-acyl-sn-glycerol-3-phosphate acyltransferase [Bacteroidia bacterium]|nr:1-acyl-sn-glycerol-3-phosphate acyltransferase [Bacteroidia bacterium]
MNKARGVLRLIAFLCLSLLDVLRIFLLQVIFPRSQSRQISYGGLKHWSRWAKRLLGVEIEYQGEFPTVSAMVLPNHRSYIDVLPFTLKLDLTFVAKVEVSRWPVIGLGARAVGTVFVDRADKASRTLTRQKMGEALAMGRSVIVFAEGTTFKAPDLGVLRPGMFQLAAEGGFPVVPVAIEYQHVEDAWVGKDTFIPHFIRCFGKKNTRIVVRFGPMMTSSDSESLRQEVYEWLQINLANIRSQISV